MKKLLLLAVLLLFGGMAVTGTLSLEIKESAVPNAVQQLFYRRDGGVLVEVLDDSGVQLLPSVSPESFTWQEKVSAPITIGSQTFDVALWDDALLRGAEDRFILVKNNGVTPCYFRTLLALENNGNIFDGRLHLNWNNDAGYTVLADSEDLCYTDMYGVEHAFKLFVFEYSKPLGVGEIAPPTLLQVALPGYLTEEDLTPLGGKYEIIAYTQAVWQDAEAETFDSPDVLEMIFGDKYADIMLERIKDINYP